MRSETQGFGRGALGVWLLVGALLGCLWLAPGASAAKKPRLRLGVKPAVVETGARVVVSGRVLGRLPKPARSLRVRVQRRVGSRWRNGSSKRLARAGRFAVTWRAPADAGRVRLRLRLTRGTRVLAKSAAWRVTVTRPATSAPGALPGPGATNPIAPAGGPPAPAPAPGPGPSPNPAATLVISQAAVADAPAPGQSGVLVLSGVMAVKSGDVLAAGIGPQSPYGFLLKATAVRVEAGRTLVDVVPATLLEAIPEGEIHETFTSTRAGSRRARFRERVACSAGGTVTIEGSADLGNPQWSVDADWGFLRLNSVKATASIGASAHASAEATGTASCTVGPIKLFETKFAPITFTIGPIPVVIVPELEIELDGLGQIDANVATSVDASITATAGAKYEDGKLSPIAELDKTFGHVPPDPQATAKLRATLASELEAKFYGAGGPDVNLNTGLEMNADSDAADPWWTLDAPISVTAGLEIDALDVEAGPITVFEKSFRLAEAAPRDPLYRIVAGRLEASTQASFSCSAGQTGCTGVTTSQKQDQSTDAAFTVAAPSTYQGLGNFETTSAIERWEQAYSYSTASWDGDCRGTTSEVDTGPVRHGGGTDPSVMYLLIGAVEEPEDGRPKTQPRIALRVNGDDKGNYTLNQAALGITWPYSPPSEDHSLIHTDYTYTYGSGCPGPGTSTFATDQDALARFPFDPDYFPFGGGELERTPYHEPLVYGEPRCTGARCVTRVSGVSGHDDARTKPTAGAAKVRMTWWFDVETCFGCAS
jgi:hypothetical protein